MANERPHIPLALPEPSRQRERNDIPILRGQPPQVTGQVHITRSFSYKLNCELHGGPRFESRDFFCSQSADCDASQAAEISGAIYEFCKSEVLKAVKEYLQLQKLRQEKRTV